MRSTKKNKPLPTWAPADLVEHIAELRRKEEDESKRIESEPIEIVDKRADLEKGRLYLGAYYLTHSARLGIAEALATDPKMENVWKNLLRRSDSFKPKPILFCGGKTPARNLFGACAEIENNWLNLPKRTRAETRRLYESISALSLQLTELLLQVDARELLETRRFVDPEKLRTFIEDLKGDGREIWTGFDDYLNHLLSDLIDPIPGLLLKLHKRAVAHAELPLAVRQPNSPNAEVNYFIQGLSEYFTRSYGQPLHAHVATVVSAVLKTDVDEDRVRALLRVRKAARKRNTRKKIAEIHKKGTG